MDGKSLIKYLFDNKYHYKDNKQIRKVIGLYKKEEIYSLIKEGI